MSEFPDCRFERPFAKVSGRTLDYSRFWQTRGGDGEFRG